MSVLDHVTSFVDGRVRLRHPALKDPQTAELIASSVSLVEGMRSAEANPRTGSLLITYDASVISRESLLAMAESGMAFLPTAVKAEPLRHRIGRAILSRRVTKTANKVMLVSLLASIGGVYAGFGGIHRAAGLVFTLAGMQHIAAHRKTL